MKFVAPLKTILPIAVVLVATTLSAVPAALADNADVPKVLWSHRDLLLERRERLLSLRSDLNARLKYLDGYRMQLDRAMAGNPATLVDLKFSRSKLRTQMDRLQTDLDDVERALLYNDQDLNGVESDIRHFACNG